MLLKLLKVGCIHTQYKSKSALSPLQHLWWCQERFLANFYEKMMQCPFCPIPEAKRKQKDGISDVYLGSQCIGMLPQTRKKLYIWKVPN